MVMVARRTGITHIGVQCTTEVISDLNYSAALVVVVEMKRSKKTMRKKAKVKEMKEIMREKAKVKEKKEIMSKKEKVKEMKETMRKKVKTKTHKTAPVHAVYMT